MIAKLAEIRAASRHHAGPPNLAEAEDFINGALVRWPDAHQQLAQVSAYWPDVQFSMNRVADDGSQTFTFFKKGRHYTVSQPEPQFDQQRLR